MGWLLMDGFFYFIFYNESDLGFNFFIKFDAMSIKICHIIHSLATKALKLIAVNRRTNCVYFLNLRE